MRRIDFQFNISASARISQEVPTGTEHKRFTNRFKKFRDRNPVSSVLTYLLDFKFLLRLESNKYNYYN